MPSPGRPFSPADHQGHLVSVKEKKTYLDYTSNSIFIDILSNLQVLWHW